METKKKGCVYTLKGDNSKFYVSSNDLERRLKQHNNDHTQTTKKIDMLLYNIFIAFLRLNRATKSCFLTKK